MPPWSFIYLGFFVLLGAAAIWNDLRDGRPGWFLACAIGSNLTIVYLFIAFWEPWLALPLGLAAPTAFIASMCWELYQAVEDLGSVGSDVEFAKSQRRVIVTITAIALLAACLPAFIVAGISAVRSW